jgi:hypothetical protein
MRGPMKVKLTNLLFSMWIFSFVFFISTYLSKISNSFVSSINTRNKYNFHWLFTFFFQKCTTSIKLAWMFSSHIHLPVWTQWRFVDWRLAGVAGGRLECDFNQQQETSSGGYTDYACLYSISLQGGVGVCEADWICFLLLLNPSPANVENRVSP